MQLLLLLLRRRRRRHHHHHHHPIIITTSFQFDLLLLFSLLDGARVFIFSLFFFVLILLEAFFPKVSL
jgi:hypothetical protein